LELRVPFLYFSLNKFDYQIDIIAESILELLVVASALVWGSLVQFLRQTVEDHSFSSNFLRAKITLVSGQKF
jgi:hypothetical protein